MPAWLLRLLKVRPDEAALTLRVALFFALIEVGRGMGGSAVDALFFRRFGVENLPFMYIGLGATTFVASLAYAAFVGRVAKGRLFAGLLLAMALTLLAERAAVLLDIRALYPVLWLSVNLIASLLGTIAWNTAGEVCDARQAKRLFPLFVSAGILGGLVGSLSTGPAARLLGTENLLVVYGLLLLAALVTVRVIARRHFPAATPDSGAQGSFLSDIRDGYDYVRRSPLLQKLALSAVLFSVLYFSVSFPFGRAVAASFTDEAELAGFLGLFSGVASVLMFGAALLVANRLYARIGIVNSILLLPVTYFAGFVLFAVKFALPTAVIVRLSQLVVMSGVGDGAYSALFNVVPAEKRAQVRAFDSGVPAQIGTILSGVLLILGERVLDTTQIFVMGMIVAVACAVVVWQMRRSHVAALVDALRAGRYDVFTSGPGVFARFHNDAVALRVVIGALDDPRPAMQALAAGMLAQMGATSAAPDILLRLGAATPEVKTAFVRALAALNAREAAEPVSALLADPTTEVRRAALDALPGFFPPEAARTAIVRLVGPLRADADVEVRARALATLAVHAADGDALRELAALTGQPDAEARRTALRALETVFAVPPPALGTGLDDAIRAAAGRLEDESPAVREAACRALAASARADTAHALAARLSDADPAVRAAAVAALRAIGAPASSAVLAALQGAPDGRFDHDAALAALSPDDPALDAPLRDYARAEVARLADSRSMAAALSTADGRAARFLAAELQAEASQRARRVVSVLGLLGDSDVMALVAHRLEDGSAESQAAALEALDMLGDRELVKAIMPMLESTPGAPDHTPPSGASDAQATALRRIMAEQDGWRRALAVRAAGELGARALLPDLHRLRADSDPRVRDTAHDALHQLGETMETLPTMSIMERVLLLKAVPLFADLQPDDLGRIAEIAHERWFADGATLCREGDHGDELYILAAGRVRVARQADGHEKLLAERGAGEFIGEMAIIDAVPRFATVYAEGDVRTLVITSNAFRAILRDRPEVALAVIHALSRRLREQG